MNVLWRKGHKNEFVVSLGISVVEERSLMRSGLVSAREPNFTLINEKLTTIRHDLMEAERMLTASATPLDKETMRLAYERQVSSRLKLQRQEEQRKIRTRNLAKVQDEAYRSDLLTIEALEQQLEECRSRVARHRKQYGIVEPGTLLTDYFDQFIQQKAAGKQHRITTEHTYTTVRNHLAVWRPELRLDETSNLVLRDFEGYLLSCGSGNSSVKHYMYKVKAVLNWCAEEHYPLHPSYKDYRVKLKHLAAPVLYCTREDIQNLLLLTEEQLTSRQCFVRDVFLLACGTGLRFSDLIRLGPQHIDGNDIRIISHKTNIECRIPITPFVRQMLERVGGDMSAHRIHHDSFNISLRAVLRNLPNWQRTLEVPKMAGKMMSTQLVPRWKLVASHCGRRTFINLAGQSQISGQRLMSMTGHTSQAMLNKYVKLQDAPLGAFEETFNFYQDESMPMNERHCEPA